jgi:hypothetical protein
LEPTTKPPVAPKKKKKERKKSRFFLKSFIFLFVLALLVAGGVVGWYFYEQIINEDPVVLDQSLLEFAEGRYYWARDNAVLGWEYVYAKVAGTSEEDVAEGGGVDDLAEGATGRDTGGETGIMTAVVKPKEDPRIAEAERLTQEGDKLYRQSRNNDWDPKPLKKALVKYKRARDLYDGIPEDKAPPRINTILQELQIRIYDCNKLMRFDIKN